jgi:hypothetical protein
MRVRLIQEGPIDADEFVESGHKLELVNGHIVGFHNHWHFERGPEERLVKALESAAQTDSGELELWYHPGAGLGQEFFPIALMPSEEGNDTPRVICENAARGSTAEELARNITSYLEWGVKLVWVLFPEQKLVHIYEPGPSVRMVARDGVLDGGEALPDFRFPAAELWGTS